MGVETQSHVLQRTNWTKRRLHQINTLVGGTFFEQVHLVLLIGRRPGSVCLHIVLEKFLKSKTNSMTHQRERRWRTEGEESEPYHPGQSRVRRDGEEDDHAGGNEVAKSAVLQGRATFGDRTGHGYTCVPLSEFRNVSRPTG